MTTRLMCVVLMLAVAVAPAQSADLRDMLKMIPGEANALVVIDLEKIMNSPISRKEGWKVKLADAYAHKPVVVLPGTRKVVMAALIEPGRADSVWEVSIMDVEKAPKIEEVVKAENGYADTLGDKPAAWSPIDAYFVQLQPNLFGAIAPANRQFASRWCRQKQTLSGAFGSNYLLLAAGAVNQGTEVVMALDLEDVTSVAKIHRRLRQEPFQCLEGKKFDLTAVATTVASIKGLTLRIEVGEDIVGKGTIEFGADTAALGDLTKPLLLELLAKAGMNLPEFADWKVTAQGKAVTAEGKLTSEGFGRLISVVNPPVPSQLIASTAAPSATETTTPPSGQPGAKPADAASPAVASQKYYQSIAKILDNLERNIGTGSDAASLADSAGWMRRDARRIDRLPILNVDKDLVAWGNEVSAKLKEVGGILEMGGMQTRASSAGAQSTYSFDASYGSWDYTQQASSEQIQLDGARRAAAQQQKAASYQLAADAMQSVRGSRAKIRALMTERYGVEF